MPYRIGEFPRRADRRLAWTPPLYLPELFPTHVRAAGSGIACNVGRFATGVGVLAAGVLFTAFGGSYPAVGATCG
ncbi:MAG: hypothetical protein MUF25_23255, partial [Pirellulaceae bacterium]|nr:hypothetical protein [Pirellulaceae bacterium]